MKPVQPVQMNNYQSDTYRNDLSWLQFTNEPRLQEWQHMKEQQSYIPVFASYVTFPSSRSKNPDTTAFDVMLYGRLEIQSNLRRNKIYRTNCSYSFHHSCKGKLQIFLFHFAMNLLSTKKRIVVLIAIMLD